MSVPFYCKPCGEMLTEDQAECPFCMGPATPLDDALHEMFAARNRAFNEQVQRILDEEERRA